MDTPALDFLEVLPVPALVCDAGGRIAAANRAAEALFGCAPDELAGRSLADLLPEPLRARHAEHMAGFFAAPRQRLMGEGRRFTALHRDGTSLALQISLGRLELGSDMLALAVLHDAASDPDAHSQARLQSAALTASANGVVISDRDGRILWVNPAFSQLTGYPLEEAVGQTTRLLRSGQHSQAFYHNMWQTVLAGQVWRGEMINRRKDGQEYYEEQTITPVLDAEGRVTHFIAIKQDISLRRQAEAALRQHTAYLEALHDVTLGLLGRRNLGELLKEIVSRAQELVEADGGYLDLVEADGQLRPAVAIGALREALSHTVRPGEGVAGMVWQTGQSLCVNDYDAWTHRISDYTTGALRAVLGVPLLSDGRVQGVLGLAYDRSSTRVFGEAEVDMLTRFAQLVVLTLDNARLYQSALQAAERRAVLLQSAQEISADLSQEHVLAALAIGVQRLLPAEAVIVFLRDVPAPIYLMWRGAARNAHNPELEAIGQQVAASGEPLLGEQLLALPLRQAGQVLGVLCVIPGPDWAGEKGDVESLQLLAAQASEVLGNVRLFQAVQQMATTDSLTGTLNRRHFFTLAEREYERSRRYPHPLSVIMLDIDHFKEVNDRLGHMAGDAVLRGVADRCRRQLREVDLLGRYGGEEFAILLPETDLQWAHQVAERLRERVGGEPLDTASEPVSVTVSLGVAALNDPGLNLDSLLERADQALYAAKHAGRNCVRIWEPAGGPPE